MRATRPVREASIGATWARTETADARGERQHPLVVLPCVIRECDHRRNSIVSRAKGAKPITHSGLTVGGNLPMRLGRPRVGHSPTCRSFVLALASPENCEHVEREVEERLPVVVETAVASSGRSTARLRRKGLLPVRGRRDDGQALVEFALVIPVLMLILLAILKFGILYNHYLQLTDAVRSGARQLAIERGQGDPCGDSAGQLIAAASLGSGLNVKITDANPADTTDIYTYPAPSGPGSGTCPPLQSGDAATVSATYPCDLSFMGINFFPGCTLTSSATERVE